MRIINLKYNYIIPLVINSIYPDKTQQEKVKEALDKYGEEDWHWEPKRVQLAILRLAYDKPSQIFELIDSACQEYRDILYFAETPLSIEFWGKEDVDPQKIKDLIKTDNLNYLKWLEKLIHPQRR